MNVLVRFGIAKQRKYKKGAIKMKIFAICLFLVVVTMVITFVAIMDNLKVTVNKEEGGADVECFGITWHYNTKGFSC